MTSRLLAVRLTAPAVLAAAGMFVTSTTLTAADSAERGKYLTEQVAQCQMCHTARLDNGEYDKSKWLKGSTLDFQPMKEVKEWHKTAPDLTPGSRLWTRWKEEGLVKFLETGLGPSGHAADPPMPTYKLSHEDAQAIVDYLKSLK